MLTIYYDIARKLGFSEAVIFAHLEYKVSQVKNLPYAIDTNRKMLLRLQEGGYIRHLKIKRAKGFTCSLVYPKNRNFVRLKEVTKEQFVYWTILKLQDHSNNPRYRQGRIKNKELQTYTGLRWGIIQKAFVSLEKKHLLNRDFTLKDRLLIPLSYKQPLFEKPLKIGSHRYYDMIDFQIRPQKMKKETPIIKRRSAEFSAVGASWDRKLKNISLKELYTLNLFDESAFIGAFARMGLPHDITTMDKSALAYFYPQLISWFGRYTLNNFISHAEDIVKVFKKITQRSRITSLTWQTIAHAYNRTNFYYAIKKQLSETSKIAVEW